MKTSHLLYVLLILFIFTPFIYADVLFEQSYSGDIVSAWADGTVVASASGYNDGSVMNEGKHWATVDDFTIAGSIPWVIDSLSFVCGTDLDAQVSTYRISIYSDDNGQPAGWENPLFRYEENATSLNYFSVENTYAGSSKDRYVQQITVDTTALNLIVDPEIEYYMSIEGDCENIEDIYNGYDTYYQRFYMLGSSDTGAEHWYSGYYDTGWSQWQQDNGNLIFAIEGHEVPEPATLLLLGLGVPILSGLRKKRRFR